MSAEPIRNAEVERALEVLGEHPEPAPLAALARDLLSRQAEGRSLFSGAAFMDTSDLAYIPHHFFQKYFLQ